MTSNHDNHYNHLVKTNECVAGEGGWEERIILTIKKDIYLFDKFGGKVCEERVFREWL